jgi:hypothetical protein
MKSKKVVKVDKPSSAFHSSSGKNFGFPWRFRTGTV